MKNKNIQAGDSSTNYQSEKQIINNNYSGVTEETVRLIADDIFKKNMTKLADEAYEIITQRAEKFINNIITKILDRDEKLLNRLKDPGVQISLYEAQKGYVKSGDKNLQEILTNLFIERLGNDENLLKTIVVEEAILIAPKLTITQLNVIALLYRLTYIRNKGLTNYRDIKWFVENKIQPIANSIPKNDLQFGHLAYAGAVVFSGAIRSSHGITRIIYDFYNGALQTGFNLGEIPKNIKELCIQVIEEREDGLYYFKSQNLKEIQNSFFYKHIPEYLVREMIDFLTSKIMNFSTLEQKLFADVKNYKLISLNWDLISRQNMRLSTVGAALAESYLVVKKIESVNILKDRLIE